MIVCAFHKCNNFHHAAVKTLASFRVVGASVILCSESVYFCNDMKSLSSTSLVFKLNLYILLSDDISSGSQSCFLEFECLTPALVDSSPAKSYVKDYSVTESW